MNEGEDLLKKVTSLRAELKKHAEKAKDPAYAALCQTSGEVLGGLEEAFDQFLKKKEKTT